MPLSNTELDQIVSRLGLTLGTEVDDPLPIKVETWAQIQDFVRQELEFHNRLRVQDMLRHVQSAAQLLANALERQDPNQIESAARNAIALIQPRPGFISARGRKGQFLRDFAETELEGVRVLLGNGNRIGDRDSFTGAFRLSAFDFGMLPTEQLGAAAAKFDLRFSEEVKAARRRLDEHDAEFEQAHREVEDEKKALQEALKKFNDDAVGRINYYDGLNAEATSASKAGTAELAALRARMKTISS